MNDAAPNLPVIFGTAGHIDHGKSSLILALTGTNPDRLKEERERGITIELGFAFMGERIAFIDVPGHERFVHHMVAGAATMDFAVLVIAADDGVMPQTREHLDILDLLGVQGGIVVLTKADLVEDGWLRLVHDEIRSLTQNTVLDSAPFLVCDSLSGRGVPQVRDAILTLARGKRLPVGPGHFRLPIDRVFTVKGFGTVVTGSVLSGSVAKGDTLELLPSGRQIRVKGVQSQGKDIARAAAGQRAALNLGGVAVDEVARGEQLLTPGVLRATSMIDVEVQVLPSSPVPLKHRQRVRIHLGTAEYMARVVLLEDNEIQPGQKGFVQLRLESPAVAQRLDRFVLRRYSPPLTLGGGLVLHALPKPHRRGRKEAEHLLRLASSDSHRLVAAYVDKTPFVTLGELAAGLSRPETELQDALETLCLGGDVLRFATTTGERFASRALYESFLAAVRNTLSVFHVANSLRAGLRQAEALNKTKTLLPKAALMPFLERALVEGHLVRPGGDLLALPDFVVCLTASQQRHTETIMKRLDDARTMPPGETELAENLGITRAELRTLLLYLSDTGLVVRIESEFLFSTATLAAVRRILTSLFAKKDGRTVSEIREALDSSRKFVVPLLSYFDAIGWTRRLDDLRFAGPNLNPNEL